PAGEAGIGLRAIADGQRGRVRPGRVIRAEPVPGRDAAAVPADAENDRAIVLAHFEGEPAGFAQQLVPVADADHGAVDSALHLQAAGEARDLTLRGATAQALLHLAQCAAYRRHQARGIALQDVIDGSAL